MLCEAFGEHFLSWTMASDWHSRFMASQVSAEDDEHSGRMSISADCVKIITSWPLCCYVFILQNSLIVACISRAEMFIEPLPSSKQ
jgi:hypothetical protein